MTRMEEEKKCTCFEGIVKGDEKIHLLKRVKPLTILLSCPQRLSLDAENGNGRGGRRKTKWNDFQVNGFAA